MIRQLCLYKLSSVGGDWAGIVAQPSLGLRLSSPELNSQFSASCIRLDVYGRIYVEGMIEERYFYVGTQMGRIEAKVACFFPSYRSILSKVTRMASLAIDFFWLLILPSIIILTLDESRQRVYLKHYESQDT